MTWHSRFHRMLAVGLLAVLMSALQTQRSQMALAEDARSANETQPAPREFIPRSVDEALRELRHTQGVGAGWSGYLILSSVTLRAHGRSSLVGDFDETHMDILMDTSGDHVRITRIDQPERGDSVDLPATIDVPHLDASGATAAGTEQVTIGGRTYTASIFDFQSESKLGRVTQYRFWLVAGIPNGGVARSEIIDFEPLGAPGNMVQAGRTGARLTDLDVVFTVAGVPVHAHCINVESSERGGKQYRSRGCYSAAIPGGIVHQESSGYERGREFTNYVMDATDFERQTQTPSASQQNKSACSVLAVLLEPGGLAMYGHGDYSGAIRSFDEMIRVDPNCITAYNNRGRAKLANKDQTGAMADFSTAIQIEPNFAAPHVNRGLVYFRQGRYDEAALDYDRAIRIEPTLAAAYANRSILNMWRFRDADSRRDYLKAIELNPGFRALLDAEIDAAISGRKR